MLWNRVIQIEGRILSSPGVVAPIDDRPFMPPIVVAHQKDRTMIPAPGFVGWEMMKGDSLHRNVMFRQDASDSRFHLRIPHIDINVLDLNEMPDQRSVNRWNRVVFVGEANALGPRPGEPGTHMSFPFGRHTKTEFVRQPTILQGGAHRSFY